MRLATPHNTNRILAIVAAGAAVLGSIALAYLLLRSGLGPVQIVKNAACSANAGEVNCNAGGLQSFVKAADALVSPAVVAMIAVAPIGVLTGASMLFFGGHRKGLMIIGSALGALVLVASVKGIIA